MPVEEVVAANPQTFFQIYWIGSRDDIAGPRRARPGGRGRRPHRHLGLVVLPWPRLGQPFHPRVDEPADHAAVRPRSPDPPALVLVVRQDGQGSRPHHAQHGARRASTPPTFFGAYGQWMGTPPPSWEDVAWLREQWGGPFMLKGVTRVDDAKRAVDAGVTAISVSNHGGQQPRRHAGHHPHPALGRRGGRRPDRGAPRRWHPSRQRRGQGGRARGPRRHDRPGLPVGPRRQRSGRRGERPRLPAQRLRVSAARPRALVPPRADARPTWSSPRASPAPSAPERRRAAQPSNLTTPRMIVPAAWSSYPCCTWSSVYSWVMSSSIFSSPVLVEVEQVRHLYPRALRPEDRAEDRLVEHGQVEEVELDVHLVERRDRRHDDAGVLRAASAGRRDELALEHARA